LGKLAEQICVNRDQIPVLYQPKQRLLRNVGKMWQRADIAHKMRVQTLLFPEGITYPGKWLFEWHGPLFEWLKI